MENRRELLVALTAAIAGAGTAQAKNGLEDAVLDLDKGSLTREPFGDLRLYFRGATDQLKNLESGSLELKAGMSPHPPHKHAEEEIMVIASGRGEISLNGKVTPCSAGTFMYCAADHYHGIENTGDEPLLFYFVKWDKKS